MRFTNENKDALTDWESVQLELMDAGVEDIDEGEEGVELICGREKLGSVIEAVKRLEIEPEDSGLEWVAKETVDLDEDAGAKVENLYDALDELDDVKGVYTNEA